MPTASDKPTAEYVPGLLPNRACRHCCQIKAKCIPLEGGNHTVCERCHRLSKQCTTRKPVGHRPRKQRSRVAQLEEKIANLTDLVSQQKDGGGSGSPTQGTPSLTDPSPKSPKSVYKQRYPEMAKPENPLLGAIPIEGMVEAFEDDTHGELNVSMQEKFLSDFRSDMSRYFPFVVIRHDSTYQSLQKDNPMLLKACIVAATYRYPALQRRLSYDFLAAVSDRMIMKSQKSLDILQGILVFASWYPILAAIRDMAFQLMNVVHLALSMIVDLGLDRPPAKPTKLRLRSEWDQLFHGPAVNAETRTNDERRALLGCFYLTSQYAFHMGRFDIMPYTRYMEQCCQELLTSAEYLSDSDVVYSIRLFQIITRYASPDAVCSIRTMPCSTYFHCFESEFNSFRESIPRQQVTPVFMEILLLTCPFRIYENVIDNESADANDKFQKPPILHRCLSLVEQYTNTLIVRPHHELPQYPVALWLQTVHSVTLLSKLNFLKMDGWDVERSRSILSVDVICQRWIQKMDRVMQSEQQSIDAIYATQGLYGRHAKIYGTHLLKIYIAKLGQLDRWFHFVLRAEREGSLANADPGDINKANGAAFAGGTATEFTYDDLSWENVFQLFDSGPDMGLDFMDSNLPDLNFQGI